MHINKNRYTIIVSDKSIRGWSTLARMYTDTNISDIPHYVIKTYYGWTCHITLLSHTQIGKNKTKHDNTYDVLKHLYLQYTQLYRLNDLTLSVTKLLVWRCLETSTILPLINFIQRWIVRNLPVPFVSVLYQYSCTSLQKQINLDKNHGSPGLAVLFKWMENYWWV